MLRVTQETLNNAGRHSHSTHIEVNLSYSGGHLRFRIRDFGVGFAPSSRANGIGLAAMRERLRMVGGSLQVKSNPHIGTELIAEATFMTRASSSQRFLGPQPHL